MLREVADFTVSAALEFTFFGVKISDQRLKQRRLTRAVVPKHANSSTGQQSLAEPVKYGGIVLTQA